MVNVTPERVRRQSPKQIAEWLHRHLEALPRNLDDLVAFPMAFRRAMASRVSPDVRVCLWREHLETFLAPGSPLNETAAAADP